MRIVLDLDGTICPVRELHQSYADVKPYPEAIQRIRELRASGHYIIIHTARNMATFEGNLGQVIKNIGKITLEWLDYYEIEYDEIYFGKPNGEVYIDDRAIRFVAWNTITDELLLQQARAK